MLASDELMRNQSGRKALIILSDGVDTGSKVSISEAIESAQRSDTLIYSILFKTTFYSIVVALVRVLELFSHMARDDRGFSVAFAAERDDFTWYHFTAVQLWLFVCFLIYIAAVEVTAVVGKERIKRILFHGPAA